MKPLIVYHGNCLDGSVSAACAYAVFKDKADYYPGIYGAQFLQETKDRDVYFLDFSLKREQMQSLEYKSLTILDHHKTAEEELRELSFNGKFDMNKSGAGLSYEYFKPDFNPAIIERVQDRDLWKFQYLETEAINAYLFTLPPFTKNCAQEWLDVLKEPIERLSLLGEGCLRTRKAITRDAMKRRHKATLAEHSIWICNATDCFSEIAHELAKDKLFGATYYINSAGRYVYSLRSIGDFDVSELAKKFGGGGHKNAAGFSSENKTHE